MSNAFVDVQVIFVPEGKLDWQSGERIQGVVVVYPKMDLGVNHLSVSMVFEIRGQMYAHKKVLYTEKLDTNLRMDKDGEYVYEFDFILTKAGTYRGKNASFYYYIKTDIDFDGETDQIARHESFKKMSLGMAIHPEKGSQVKQELLIKSDWLQYIQSPIQANLSMNALSLSNEQGLFLGILFIASLIGAIFFKNPLLVLPALIGIAAYMIGRHLFFSKKIGTVQLDLKPINSQQFKANFLFEKEMGSAKKIVSYYKIIEKVVDNRGTSSSTSKHTIFTSSQQVEREVSKESNFTYTYPSKRHPPSITYGDAEIKWELVLEIDFGSGMLGKMTYPLNVSFHQTKG